MTTDLSRHRVRQRWRLTGLYMAGSLALASMATVFGGIGLLLFWPSFAALFVALLYASVGPPGFGKGPDGRMNLPTKIFLAPYLLAAWANSRLWTRARPGPDMVAEGVWIGRFPSWRDLKSGRFATVVDLSAELPGFDAGVSWRAFPMMDLVVPPTERLAEASQCIDESRARGPVLVACALGYSRSAAAVATWLVKSGRSRTAEEAASTIRAARPGIVIGDPALAAVRRAASQSS